MLSSPPQPRVVVASDKFKGTLTSAEVAAAVGAGVRRVRPDVIVEAIPVADGGDGTLAAAVAAGFELVPTTASGPTGEPVQTAYARRGESRVRGDVAVVELADVSGLVRLPGGQPAPLTATSYGTGELIAAAIDAGCRKVILGIGGSASTDGGAGLVRALGARLSGRASNLVEGGAALAAATSLDLTALRRRLDGVQIVVACDVDNPLTGPNGAAAVYGPQKGADPRQVEELDAALTRWADLVARETGRDLRDAPGAGAAGGVGFAALALLGAELRPGIELVLEMVGFHEHLVGADLVITGEGALDEQTLHGKAVAGVAAAAASARASGAPSLSAVSEVAGVAGAPGASGAAAPGAPGTNALPGVLASLGIPVVAVCGVNRLEPEQLRAAGVRAAYALTDLEPDVQRCIAEPIPLLERLGERIAGEHLR